MWSLVLKYLSALASQHKWQTLSILIKQHTFLDGVCVCVCVCVYNNGAFPTEYHLLPETSGILQTSCLLPPLESTPILATAEIQQTIYANQPLDCHPSRHSTMPEQKRLPPSVFAAINALPILQNPPKPDRATPLPSETWMKKELLYYW